MDIITLRQTKTLDSTFPLPRDEPFTTTQARGEGLSRWHLETLVDVGALRRPLRGVYVASAVADSLQHRLACLRLVTPEDCVIVDTHAGWLHGAEMVLAPGEHLDLRPVSLFRPAGHGRLRNVLADSGERAFLDRDVVEMDGVRVTSPLRTALDLGRVRRTDRAISALDAMLRLGSFSRAELLAEVGRFRGHRWVTTLRAIAPIADGRAESPPESILRLRCIECGLAGMTPQVEVYDAWGRFIARLDLADPELMAAVEYDGVEWHSSPDQQEHDRSRRGLARDEGWLVEPFTKENLFGHFRDVETRLHQIRDEVARRRRGRPAS